MVVHSAHCTTRVRARHPPFCFKSFILFSSRCLCDMCAIAVFQPTAHTNPKVPLVQNTSNSKTRFSYFRFAQRCCPYRRKVGRAKYLIWNAIYPHQPTTRHRIQIQESYTLRNIKLNFWNKLWWWSVVAAFPRRLLHIRSFLLIPRRIWPLNAFFFVDRLARLKSSWYCRLRFMCRQQICNAGAMNTISSFS